MSQRMYDIIDELEIDYGVQLHANDILDDVLCLHDTCVDTCPCWDEFRDEVELAMQKKFRLTDIDRGTAKMLKKSKLRKAV